MEDIELTATDITPAVKFNSSTGHLQIIGTSMPEDSPKFFSPLIDWLIQFKKKGGPEILLDFKMQYINTSSEIFILQIIKNVVQIKQSDRKVQIRWFFKKGDSEMEYTGMYLGKTGNFPVELVEY